MRTPNVTLLLMCLAITGCFDLGAEAKFHESGKATVEVEIGISMQMAAMIAGLAKDKADGDLLKQCEERSTQGRTLPQGVRWIKSVRGTRGEMMTCTAQFEVDDPVEAAKSWAPNSNPEAGTVVVSAFQLQRLSSSSYRLSALIEATKPKPVETKEPNPFEAMFATATLNRFITVSVIAARIENTTGEVSDDGRRVTWKMPVLVILKPPPGYKQEVRADIVYDDGWLGAVRGWFSTATRSLGLDSPPSSSSKGPQPPEKPVPVGAADERKRLEGELATARDEFAKAQSALAEKRSRVDAAGKRLAEARAHLDNIVITEARFRYEKQSYRDEPIISFKIANNGTIPVKRIYVAANLQTPGRSVPWLTESFNHDIRGGLEPKEAQTLSLAPNSFSEWGKVPREAVGTAVLTLKLTSFLDAKDTPIGDVSSSQKLVAEAASEANSVEASIERLERRIDDLTKRLTDIR